MTIPTCSTDDPEIGHAMPGNKPDRAGVYWYVSKSLAREGERWERHAFRDHSGQNVEALCEHLARADNLLPDDDALPRCTRCQVALGTDLADRLGNRRPLD